MHYIVCLNVCTLWVRVGVQVARNLQNMLCALISVLNLNHHFI